MKKSRLVMIIGVLLLANLYVLPLWNITLGAPQYPDGIGMDIYINKIDGARSPSDIQNINILNHYVGMKEIPKTMTEFETFPWIIGIMMVLGLLSAFKLNYKFHLVWFIVMLGLGVMGIYDFYLWEYDYGHNLNPKAIMKFLNPDGTRMAYQPPLFGSKDILNFQAHSYPHIGGYLMFLGMGLTLLAFFIGKKEAEKI